MKKLPLKYQIVTKTYLKPTYETVVTVVKLVTVGIVVTKKLFFHQKPFLTQKNSHQKMVLTKKNFFHRKLKMWKIKNSKCDNSRFDNLECDELKMWQHTKTQNLKPQNGTKLRMWRNSKTQCDKTQKLIMWQTTTQNATIQKLKMWQNSKT